MPTCHVRQSAIQAGLIFGSSPIFTYSTSRVMARNGQRSVTPVGINRLEGPELEETAVTDAGLVHLVGLANLEELQVGATLVTDRGIQEYQAARANWKSSNDRLA